jgi:hypothetical protein
VTQIPPSPKPANFPRRPGSAAEIDSSFWIKLKTNAFLFIFSGTAGCADERFAGPPAADEFPAADFDSRRCGGNTLSGRGPFSHRGA